MSIASFWGWGFSAVAWPRPKRAEPVTDHQVITLWPGGAPGAKGNDPEQDIPTLTAWLAPPENATGAAVVVCPGGGYGMLASDHEGKQVAEWLNSLGVSAFVLKYRLGPRYHHPAMLQDAGRAIRTVRALGQKWGVDPHRIAILGFSAGGHLGLDGWHPFRCRQAASRGPGGTRQLPARPADPDLSRDRPGHALRPQRVKEELAGR